MDKAVDNPQTLYAARRRIRHIETPHCRVTELQLAPGQCIPWHKHTDTHDTFYVMEGVVRVRMEDPAETVDVGPGQTYAVPSGRPHLVESATAAPTTFLLLQGIGKCDFVPIRHAG